MNRLLRLHPLSFALGIVLGGICLLSMSQAIVATSPLRIEYAPHPRDMVTIREGVPYVVPAGRVLVITGVGTSWMNGSPASVRINGQDEASSQVVVSSGSGLCPSVVHLAPGLTASSGASVEAVGGYGGDSTDARVLGYLAPQ